MVDSKPTVEQQAIIAAAKQHKDLVIQAGAGTGKTSTLKMIAAAIGETPTLYVAYNKSIGTEAAASFPAHVMCRTAHSLAHRAVGREYAHRLNGPRELPALRAEILKTAWLNLSRHRSISPVQMARMAVETVMRFCYSADDDVDVQHVPIQNGILGAEHDELSRVVFPYARRAWADVRDLDGQLKFQHDHYLKMWALTRPGLPAEVVMLDEAQDSNPVVAQLVQQQGHAQLIAVGDSCQALYGWRGARDALTDWPADERFFLSQSWRFGEVIAGEANRWLSSLNAGLRLTGNPLLRSEITDLSAPNAVLCRTNAEAVKQVMAMLAEDRRVALAGGGNEIRRLAHAAAELKSGRRTSHSELYVFDTWAALQEYADSEKAGRDLKPFVELIDAHGPEEIIAAIDSLTDEARAETLVSTAHKAKGRAWDSVQIAEDFPIPTEGEEIPRADAMLAYVAVTRSRMQLDRRGLAWIDRHGAAEVGRGQRIAS